MYFFGTQTPLSFVSANAVGASGYNEVIQSIYFRQYHHENDGGTGGQGVQSAPSQDNGTSGQQFLYAIGNAADECACGELHIFNPAGTTFAKMWYARTNSHAVGANDLSYEVMVGGYFNVTLAIDDFEFKMSSGNIADGKIKLYGVA